MLMSDVISFTPFCWAIRSTSARSWVATPLTSSLKKPQYYNWLINNIL